MTYDGQSDIVVLIIGDGSRVDRDRVPALEAKTDRETRLPSPMIRTTMSLCPS